MSRVLIIEDEKNLARFVELELKHEGYETDVRYDGRNGLEAALDEKESWDVILLDVMLPELNGIDVCRRIRQVSNVPIIMITAKSETFDKVLGLELGADDYIVKPFDTKEVIARIKAVSRSQQCAYHYDDCT